ncbi:hypothetical protein [Streptomyces albus]
MIRRVRGSPPSASRPSRPPGRSRDRPLDAARSGPAPAPADL